MVSDRMSELAFRDRPAERQQVADLAARITHDSPLEWHTTAAAPDLIGKLKKELSDGLQTGNPP